MIRTEWLTLLASVVAQVSIKLQKTRKREVHDDWHTHCQKRATEGVRNEKGVSKYLLFVGLEFDGDSGWSANTNETV